MTEKKKDFLPEQSDIHTIVDLPLELVRQYLLELSSKYTVSIRADDEDRDTFLLQTKRQRDLVMVQARGSLRRWNGTLTRLDADISVHQAGFNPLGSPLIVVILGMVMLLVVNMAFSALPLPLIVTIFLTIALVGFLLFSIIFDINKTFFDAKKAKNLKVYRALMNELEDDLKRKLKQKSESLEFDGTEDNLGLLLQDEKHKRFRLGADGEIVTP